jgi:hypothetical protein
MSLLKRKEDGAVSATFIGSARDGRHKGSQSLVLLLKERVDVLACRVDRFLSPPKHVVL